MGKVENEIRKLIVERYGSVVKFASEIGLPAQTVYSALRNGIAGSSLVTAMPIVTALQIDPAELVQGNLVKVEPKE